MRYIEGKDEGISVISGNELKYIGVSIIPSLILRDKIKLVFLCGTHTMAMMFLARESGSDTFFGFGIWPL